MGTPPTKTCERAAIYLRVSTSDQTTDNQLVDCVRVADARQLPYEVFTETGSAAKHRPVYESVKLRAHRGEFTHVIVWAIDRLGRSMAGNVADIIELDRRNVAVLSVRETWMDTGGPMRGLLIAIMSWQAETERTRLIERTLAGMARARKAGKVIGRPKGRKDSRPRRKRAAETRPRKPRISRPAVMVSAT